MKTNDWLILLVVGALLYVATKIQTLASTPIAPGTPTPGGGLLTLPPGLPSGQAAINAALGYDATGNPINSGAGGAGSGILPSTLIGQGYMDLAPNLNPSITFDSGLVSDTSDQGDFGLAPLPSFQTVPFTS